MPSPAAMEDREGQPASADLSREADRLLAEFDLVLRCRCCVQSGAAFTTEDWASSDPPIADASWL